MPVNFIQYRGTVGIFNSRHFVFDLKYKDQPLLVQSHSNVFYITPPYPEQCCFFLFLAVFLILKLNICKKNSNSRASPFLVAVFKTWLEAAWFYSLPLLLSGDVELNPVPKRNPRNAFSICHWNLISISAHSYAKVFLLKAYIV